MKKQNKTNKTSLQITGMHCASCASLIERSLTKKSGVTTANVNYATNKAQVEYDHATVSEDDLIAEIKKQGYDAQTTNQPKKTSDENHDEHAHHGVSLDPQQEHLKTVKATFIQSVALGIPLFYITMGEMIGLPQPTLSYVANLTIQFFLATLIMVVNKRTFVSGLKKIVAKGPNMDSLIAIGTLSAYIYSLVVFFNILNQPSETMKMEHVYFESAGLILAFIAFGKYLEELTKGRTSQAIKKLMGLQAKTALVIKNGKEVITPIKELKVGDLIKVKPGEKIATDGKIVEGHSAVDEKMLTGESIPVEKTKGNTVIGATINKSGTLTIKATKVGEDTMLSQIVKTVEEAIGSKAPIQLLADTVSFYFVPSVFAIAIITFFIWILLGQSFVFALTAFVSVLIIACPCSLGLATPTAVMMGTGLAAQNGILMKNSKALETANKIDIFVFDKTGTLTIGEPKVTDVVAFNKDKKSILSLAASIEQHSEHPLAQAVVLHAKEKKIALEKTTDFENLAGQGITAKLGKQVLLLGNRSLMKKHQIAVDVHENDIQKLENEGKTTVILANTKEILGIIAIADVLKQEAQTVVKTLKKMHKQVWMITGDNSRVAQAIAKDLHLDGLLSDVLPHQKSEKIKQLQSNNTKVAMVGDGINDAPALAQADLGIAMASGTDIAMETGDIVLIKNNLQSVVTAIDVSAYTLRKIKQNLFWAFFYNTVGIPVAAGILYPITGMLLNPAIAALAMAFSSVSVVGNSLLMKFYTVKKLAK
jgi:Cu+-exporting ATPase